MSHIPKCSVWDCVGTVWGCWKAPHHLFNVGYLPSASTGLHPNLRTINRRSKGWDLQWCSKPSVWKGTPHSFWWRAAERQEDRTRLKGEANSDSVHLRPAGSQSPDTYRSCQIKTCITQMSTAFFQDERQQAVFSSLTVQCCATQDKFDLQGFPTHHSASQNIMPNVCRSEGSFNARQSVQVTRNSSQIWMLPWFFFFFF